MLKEVEQGIIEKQVDTKAVNRQRLPGADEFGHFTVLTGPEESKEEAAEVIEEQKIKFEKDDVKGKLSKRQKTRARAKRSRKRASDEIDPMRHDVEETYDESESFVESKATTTEEAYLEKETIQRKFREKQMKGKVRFAIPVECCAGCDKKEEPVMKLPSLSILGTIEPEGVRAVGEQDGEWQEIDFAVDSGASETVINEGMGSNIKMTESAGSKRGVNYEVANGEYIPNEGEKKLLAVSEEFAVRDITAQVCDVNKALLSVRRIAAAGHTVVFDSAGSYIIDKQSGEKMWLREEGGMYMLKMWVKAPFQRQGA